MDVIVVNGIGHDDFALKVIQKRRILDAKQERGILRERELLGLLHHPFILTMVASFQDSTNLYLVLPLIQGGELFNVVAARAKGGHGLPNNHAAFYAAVCRADDDIRILPRVP